MNEMPLRNLQVICGVFIAGLLMFALVVTGMLLLNQTDVDRSLLSLLGPASAAAFVASFIAQQVIARSQTSQAARQRQEDRADATTAPRDDAELMGRFATLTVLRFALLEGPALMAVTTTMLTGDWTPMALAAAGLLVMAILFPSRARLEAFTAAVKRG